MEQYIIKGGVPLHGEVSIGGAKNAALGILAAAIMTDETVTIENVPNVRDTRVLLQAIEGIGAKVKYVYNNSVQINGGSICDFNVDYEYIKKIRAIANAPQRYNTDFLGKKTTVIKQKRIRQTHAAG